MGTTRRALTAAAPAVQAAPQATAPLPTEREFPPSAPADHATPPVVASPEADLLS